MSEAYTLEDRKRTAPIFEALLADMAPAPNENDGPWVDLDAWADIHGAKAGTVKSKFREVSDKHHADLGLLTESKPVPGKRGAWLYRLVRKPVVQPVQMELLEA